MSDDRFFERLREDARPLQFAPDEWMRSRIAARVRERIASQPTVAGLLARWFAPVAASLAAVALAASLSFVWIEQRSETSTVDTISSTNPVEITAAGDIYSVGE